MCDYVNYHIVMFVACGLLSMCLACAALALKAYHGSNPTPQQEDSVEACSQWALTALVLTFGFEGALILFYAIGFVTIAGMVAYLGFVELHQIAMHAARLLSRRSNTIASTVVEEEAKMSPAPVATGAQATCPICLETDTGPWLTTRCGHVFHRTCIRRWQKDTCPMCREHV
jgi:hypothetical protein